MLFRVKLWLAAVGAFLVALGAAYWRGRSAGDAAAERERLQDYVETRERMDEEDIPDNAADARKWLHERQRRGDL